MVENFIFSGLGHAYGENAVTNEMLEKAVKDGRLDGFDEERIAGNEDYFQWICGEKASLSHGPTNSEAVARK